MVAPPAAGIALTNKHAAAALEEISLRILRYCACDELSRALAVLHSAPSKQAYDVLLRFSNHTSFISSKPFNLSDLRLSNHFINLYAKCERIDLAQQVFESMPQRNIVSWTSLISGYAQHKLHSSCFRLFAAMIGHHIPNEFALSSVLSSCGAAAELYSGCQAHALAQKISLDVSSIHVGNALVTLYSRCCKGGYESWSMFESLPHRNLITWNTMVAGFVLRGFKEESLGMFIKMLQNGIRFDRATLVSVISSCVSFCQCQGVQTLVIKTGFESEVEVATSLAKVYSDLGDSGVHEYHQLFKEVIEHDIVSWTSIMTMNAESAPEQALSIFCYLREAGYRLDRYAFSIAIKASAGMAIERHCMALHSLILRSGFRQDTVLSNALIHAYSRCGNLRLAEIVFQFIEVHDRVSWNSIIKAYAAHGRGKDALGKFAQMDIPPDSATFVGLLTACSHSGLVDEGYHIFCEMTEHYGIRPDLDHYACVIDILGRAGNLSYAEVIINQMPLEPDAVIWSALLAACNKHHKDKNAEKAAKKLMELVPQNSLGYVLMSNIYCATGSFWEAAFLRKEMKSGMVKKELGLSWIEVENHVHVFSTGGRHHPQKE